MGPGFSSKDETDNEDILGEKRQYRVCTTPTTSRLIVKRNGHSITRKIPKPVVLVDTREQDPLSFDCLPNWIAETRKQKLDAGDYSVQGMEHLLALERKSLSDLISTLTQNRKRFFNLCERLATYRWRALLVEASYEDLKSPYDEGYTEAHPNAVSGTLDALEVKFGIPVIYASRFRPLGSAQK